MAGTVQEFTDANWKSEVLESEQPVVVDFWAPWCGPCRMLAPTIAKLAEEFAGKVKFGKLDTDQNVETPSSLFTIADLGGWPDVATKFFDAKTGIVAAIEKDIGVAVASK